MQTLFSIISLTFFLGLLVVPFLLYNFVYNSSFKHKFAFYIISALLLTIIVIPVFCWWSYTSDLILLKHYGFNDDGMNESEFYAKVLPENLDKVKSLEAGIMEIGWPLKAIITLVFYSPYLLMVYFLKRLLEKRRLEISKSLDL